MQKLHNNLTKMTFFAKYATQLLSTVLCLTSANLVFAGEGFSSTPDNLPLAIAQRWSSVFMLAPAVKDGAPGTALLVKREPIPGTNKVHLYFLTANHLVDLNCGNSMGSCPNIFLTASKGLDTEAVQYYNNDDKNLTLKENNNIIIARRSVNPDLALLRAEGDASVFGSLPVFETSDCNSIRPGQGVYQIGYPMVFRRQNSSKRMNYPENIIRRWSSGYLTEPFTLHDSATNSTAYYFGSTADSLSGSSGSCAVDTVGRLIGVIDGALIDENSSYSGDESSVPRKMHARLTRCEYLADFIHNRAMTKNPDAPTDQRFANTNTR